MNVVFGIAAVLAVIAICGLAMRACIGAAPRMSAIDEAIEESYRASLRARLLGEYEGIEE